MDGNVSNNAKKRLPKAKSKVGTHSSHRKLTKMLFRVASPYKALMTTRKLSKLKTSIVISKLKVLSIVLSLYHKWL
jgi:hypothetical protein